MKDVRRMLTFSFDNFTFRFSHVIVCDFRRNAINIVNQALLLQSKFKLLLAQIERLLTSFDEKVCNEKISAEVSVNTDCDQSDSFQVDFSG